MHEAPPAVPRYKTGCILPTFCYVLSSSPFVPQLMVCQAWGYKQETKSWKKGLRSELVVEVTMDDLAVDVVEMTGLLMLLLLLLEDHWLVWLRLRLMVMMVLLLLSS